MPPRMVPNASGISSREGLTPDLCAAPETAGSSTAAAAMLFMNRERKAAVIITATTSRCSLSPATRTSRSPTCRVTPVRSRPAARMKIASSVITADRLNPENVSCDVSTPDVPRATTTRSATRSARRRSVSRSSMAAPAMTRVVRRCGLTSNTPSPNPPSPPCRPGSTPSIAASPSPPSRRRGQLLGIPGLHARVDDDRRRCRRCDCGRRGAAAAWMSAAGSKRVKVVHRKFIALRGGARRARR